MVSIGVRDKEFSSSSQEMLKMPLLWAGGEVLVSLPFIITIFLLILFWETPVRLKKVRKMNFTIILALKKKKNLQYVAVNHLSPPALSLNC